MGFRRAPFETFVKLVSNPLQGTLVRNPVIPTIVLFALLASPADARQPIPAQSPDDLSIQAFVQALETAISTTERERWTALLSPNNDPKTALAFFESFVPQVVTRAVVYERRAAGRGISTHRRYVHRDRCAWADLHAQPRRAPATRLGGPPTVANRGAGNAFGD
jgi:hypothetical protein